MLKEEFEERVIGMQDAMYRIASTILPQKCDREDAIQECVLKALKKRDGLRSDEAFRAWLTRILVNECYALIRRRRRELPSEALPEPEPEPDADPEVFRLLFSLEDKLRLPMALYHVEGYSVAEIAKMLRLPSGTVKTRLARARKLIRRELEDDDFKEVARRCGT